MNNKKYIIKQIRNNDMITKRHILILGVIFSMLFMPAFVTSVNAGANCSDISCNNETECNNYCNDRKAVMNA